MFPPVTRPNAPRYVFSIKHLYRLNAPEHNNVVPRDTFKTAHKETVAGKGAGLFQTAFYNGEHILMGYIVVPVDILHKVQFFVSV
jgi:hypothetical protein